MRKFIQMPAARRQEICTQVEARTGLPSVSVEKDFWVCWTLDLLFHLPVAGKELTFKGGTSLSKGWQLIERFSEDIDIVINREVLGYVGEKAPETAPSRNQRQKRLKGLKEASQTFIVKVLGPELYAAIEEELGSDSERPWQLVEDPDDPDHETLLFAYPSALPEQMEGYVPRVVKIEMGARSDTEPILDIAVTPYISETFPDLFPHDKILLRAVAPKRTFWEKAMLLHEETFRTADKNRRKKHLARHYYDLYRMIKAGIAQEAAADLDLFQSVAQHRQAYFDITWVDYNTLIPGDLRLLPTPEQRPLWNSDYTEMRAEMFFGEVPDFDEVLAVVEQFQNEFNQIDSPE